MVAVAVVPLLLLAAFVLVVEPIRVQAAARAGLERHAERATAFVAPMLSNALEERDDETLRAWLDPLTTDEDVRYAEVRDGGGRVVASTGPATWDDGAALEVRTPVAVAEGDPGELRVIWSLARIEAEHRARTATARLAAAGILLVGIAASLLAATLLVRRIGEVTDAACAVVDGTATLSAVRQRLGEGQRDSTDEADRLTHALAAMTRRIARQVRQIDVERTRAVEAEAEAKELSQAKAHFLAIVSHELRTPLSAIIGYAELMRELVAEEGRADLAADLDRIHAAGCHVLGLVNDILDLTKLEAGRMEVHLERADLDEAVRQVQGAVEPLISRNANRFVVLVPVALGPAIVDVEKFKQCLLNLLGNAAKFTRDGEVELSVLVEDEWLVARVRDTGIGMSAEQMDVLAQAVQADATTTRRFGGSGLGLALTRQLATILGGGIDVTSELGRGTTFTLRLPFSAARVASGSPS